MNLMRRQHILIIKYTNGCSPKSRERIDLRIKISFELIFVRIYFENGWIRYTKNSHNLKTRKWEFRWFYARQWENDREVYVHESVYWCVKKKHLQRTIWLVICAFICLRSQSNSYSLAKNSIYETMLKWKGSSERERERILLLCGVLATMFTFALFFLFHSIWWART